MAEDDYKHVSRKWTKEKIIAAIQEKTVDGYCKSTAIGMVAATMARRLFGSFSAAAIASGAAQWNTKPRPEFCVVDGCKNPLRSTRAEYCEMHYGRVRFNGTTRRLDGSDISNASERCLYCAAPTNRHTKFCSENCQYRERQGCPISLICVACGKAFDPRGLGKTTCCSESCRVARDRAQNRQWRAQNYELYLESARITEYKRKARKRATEYEKIDRMAIFIRDRWVCQLCKTPVDRALAWPNGGAATLDHIEALANGGTHTADNVQLAHLSCNCKKSNKGQRRLLF